VNASGRRAAHAALVVVGITLGIFGAAQLAAVQQSSQDDAGGSPMAVVGTSVGGIGHAVAERPASSATTWVNQVSLPAAVTVAAALMMWTIAVIDGCGAVPALLDAPWRRRGPPTLLA
jgi:hypothetical protein